MGGDKELVPATVLVQNELVSKTLVNCAHTEEKCFSRTGYVSAMNELSSSKWVAP